MNSIVKKIINVDLEALVQGKHNFDNPNLQIENLAKKRLEKCLVCPDFVEEPIDIFRVIDKKIPKLSNKMCNQCGCIQSYKLRQSIKICKLW